MQTDPKSSSPIIVTLHLRPPSLYAYIWNLFELFFFCSAKCSHQHRDYRKNFNKTDPKSILFYISHPSNHLRVSFYIEINQTRRALPKKSEKNLKLDVLYNFLQITISNDQSQVIVTSTSLRSKSIMIFQSDLLCSKHFSECT